MWEHHKCGQKNHKSSIQKLGYLLLDEMSTFLLLVIYSVFFCCDFRLSERGLCLRGSGLMGGVLMKYDLYTVKLVIYLHCMDLPFFHVGILRCVFHLFFHLVSWNKVFHWFTYNFCYYKKQNITNAGLLHHHQRGTRGGSTFGFYRWTFDQALHASL